MKSENGSRVGELSRILLEARDYDALHEFLFPDGDDGEISEERFNEVMNFARDLLELVSEVKVKTT